MKLVTIFTAVAISAFSMTAAMASWWHSDTAAAGTTTTAQATDKSGFPTGAIVNGKPEVIQPFSPEQTEAIQRIVHQYLLQHPEVLMEVAHALQAQQAKQMEAQAMGAIGQNKQKLFQNSVTPIGGNPNGKIALVEFFDYQCGHCKAMQPILESLLKKDNNIKIIYKQLPIFGDNSEFAAKAALAAVRQGKYQQFHKALFSAEDGLTPDKVLQIASANGLDTSKLQKDMKDPAIEKQIKDNFQLAQVLHLVGTPSFILSNQGLTSFEFIPGATTEQDLQQRIADLVKGKAGLSSPDDSAQGTPS